MPELPEVEVIRRSLERQIPGRVAAEIQVREPKIALTHETEILRRLKGQVVASIGRRGKYLLIYFERDVLLIHLRMTGQLTFWSPTRQISKSFYIQPETGLQQARQHAIDKHTHFILGFEDGCALYYRDIRKFGRLQLLNISEIDTHPGLIKLGVEPLGPDYSWAVFKDGFKNRKKNIKSLLLDQQIIAGLGNIYVDEALFLAKIRPNRSVQTLKQGEFKKLFESIPIVLEKGIHFGGTTLRDYIDSEGKKGSNQEQLLVYGRQSKPCYRCQTPIQKIVLAQRGTHFCPKCQV